MKKTKQVYKEVNEQVDIIEDPKAEVEPTLGSDGEPKAEDNLSDERRTRSRRRYMR